MADVIREILSDEESPAKCGDGLNQSLVKQRFPSVTGTSPSSTGNQNRKEKLPKNPDRRNERKRNRTDEMEESNISSSSLSSSGDPESTSNPPKTVCQIPVIDLVPAFGSISVSGRSREMEDAIVVRADFCRPAISGGRPLHFFAVYDGHGGSHVAELCKERMHVFLEEELMKQSIEEECSDTTQTDNEDRLRERWISVMKRCFEKMDEMALTACACGSVGTPCGCDEVGLSSEIVGSTAVVAVLTPHRILVANCGDSRAVLSRGGRAIPLSFDHKPDRPDELARTEAAGGRVIYLNGPRVQGILAMSRALGDKYLKPIVISEPEVSFTERTPEDECLILASDGLWDVLSNEMACDVARRCLFEASKSTTAAELNPLPPADTSKETSMERVYQSWCSLAAALLTRLALGRKSTDNISVIVVDLRGGGLR